MSDLDIGRIVLEKLGSSLWVVALCGEHDLSTAPKVHATIEGILAQGTTVVLDLSSTTFIDSSILGELIFAQQYADANRNERLAIVAPQHGAPARLIALVDAGRLFNLFETFADALHWTTHPEHASALI